jgi:hypothetical protein
VQYHDQDKLLTWSDARRTSLSSLFGSTPKEPSSLSVLDVTDVKRGIHTDVLKRGGLLDPHCCLSVITADRTLDLVFGNATERDSAYKGLQAIAASVAESKIRFS